MRLLKLVLRNFKGAREFVLETVGGNVSVWGDNSTGKTTLADAFMWLLFDKDSSNRKDFEIKTLGPDGQPIHGLEHEVEAVLDLEPGRLTLRKVYQEQWTKKRGSATKQFTGHTTDHFVDGVPVSKTEFASRVASIADEGAFRLLTDPLYFNTQLHWQKRREILLQVCGDVSDAEVIASSPDLAGLPEILGNRTLEQHRKVIAARRSEINQELDRIPVRIDEARRSIPETAGNATVLQAQVNSLRARRQEIEAESIRIQSGGEAAELNKRLREIDSALLDLQHRQRAQTDEAVQEARQRAAGITREVDSRTLQARRLRAEIAEDQLQISKLQTRIEELRQEWFSVDGQQPVLSIDEVCPTCGQDLPADQVTAAREKAAADHNARKAKRLEEITAEGKRLADQVAALQQRIATNAKAAEAAEQAAVDMQRQAAEIQQEIARLQASTPAPEADPEARRLQAERQQIEQQLHELQEGNTGARLRIASRMQELDEQIAAVEADLGRIAQRERGLKRIEELEADERRLAAEFEELERQLYLTEQFIRSKVQLLESRINSRFQLARFKLFDQQVNGGITEVCETTVGGVPYSSLNNGARVQVGLDIIRTLQGHYGLRAPVWIDNRESVTAIPEMDCQVISLIVSERDTALRVEREEAVLSA